MSQNKWDDDKIEDLLSSVPKMKDNRTKDEILKRLKDDGVFDDEPSEKTVTIKKKRTWIPPLITVAAIALIALMIPSLMNQMESGKNEVANSSMDAREASEESTDMNAFSAESAETKIGLNSNEFGILADDNAVNLRTSVYPEDLEGYTVFHIGLSGDQAYNIPFTILIPKEQVMEDLGKPDPTGVELYNYYAPLFNEEAIGFQNYHPYKGTISENGNQVIHTLPPDHGYDMGSASERIYIRSLMDTFKSYNQAVLLNEDGSPAGFAHTGLIEKPIELHSETTQNNYFRISQDDGSVFLSTYGGESYATVIEALENMKLEVTDPFQSVILPGVDYTVAVNGEAVIVEFTSELDLLSYDQVSAMQMIEGILLTAASFNMEVKFENVLQSDWGGFDFTNPLPIPIGPNKLPLLVE